MSRYLSLLQLPLDALSLALPWAPQLGSEKTQRKQGQLETSEGWANTSCSQVWLGNKKPADGGQGVREEGTVIPAPHVSQQEDAFLSNRWVLLLE